MIETKDGKRERELTDKDKLRRIEQEIEYKDKLNETNINNVHRCVKLRIYPTKRDRLQLKRWNGVYRYVYNRCLSKIRDNSEKPNFQILRDKYVTAKGNNLNEWELNVPKEIRANSVQDLTKAYTTCFSQLKSGLISQFNVSYKSKKQTSSMGIPHSALSIHGRYLKMYPKFLNRIRLSNDKFIKKHQNFIIKRDCRLIYENRKWFMSVPYIKQKTTKDTPYDICALDPGCRSFMTGYSQGQIFEVIQNKELLAKLDYKLDRLRSKRAKKVMRRCTYARLLARINNKHKNVISELHYKTANYLVKHYKMIMLPSFETQDMVKRNPNKKVNRNLMNLNHFKFKQRLSDVCDANNAILDICTEEFTSQTCPKCGILTKNGSKTFKCSDCKFTIDRDVNGARNIFMKTILNSARVVLA